ncbi:MAG TPA: hypothetical protein VER76_14490 [Pyrinomonadaceae bacterium]|nr:hypothetical protein [Pyrinomonadaceae bacterium]
MGGLTNAVTGIMGRARQDATFRQELQDNPRQVLERELGRKLSAEELAAALAELKKHGIENKPDRS